MSAEFEDEKDPANQPIDREDYEAWERDRAAQKRLADAAPDLLAALQRIADNPFMSPAANAAFADAAINKALGQPSAGGTS